MRLRCHLRLIRGPRPMRELAREAGVNAGYLSEIESGIRTPRDRDLAALEAAYGRPITDWYPDVVLVALEPEDDAHEALAARLHTVDYDDEGVVAIPVE